MGHAGFNPHGRRALVYASGLLGANGLLYYTVFSILIIVGLMLFFRSTAAGARSVVVIKMVDMPPMFEPARTTIKVGETVEWQNVGNEVHHATSDPSLAIKSSEVTNPPGVKPFDSGFLRPGETFTHTFPTAGVYKYTCVVHEAKGMLGEIVVK